jgi:hypothetical protein
MIRHAGYMQPNALSTPVRIKRLSLARVPLAADERDARDRGESVIRRLTLVPRSPHMSAGVKTAS